MVLLRTVCVGHQKTSTLACRGKELGRKPTDVEHRVEPTEIVDRLAHHDEIERTLPTRVEVHDVGRPEVDDLGRKPSPARSLDRRRRDVQSEHPVSDVGEPLGERACAATELDHAPVTPTLQNGELPAITRLIQI